MRSGETVDLVRPSLQALSTFQGILAIAHFALEMSKSPLALGLCISSLAGFGSRDGSNVSDEYVALLLSSVFTPHTGTRFKWPEFSEFRRITVGILIGHT